MWKLIGVLGLVLAAALSACADSSEEAGGDTDADTDGDGDADSDSDSDGDTEDTEDTACECTNESQPCCDGCHYYGPDHVCDPEYEQVLQCAGETCGGDVQLLYRPRFCSGDEGLCTGAVGDDGDLLDGGVSDDCGSNELCGAEIDGGVQECGLDLAACPGGFGDRGCWPGGTLPDCGTAADETCDSPQVLDVVFSPATFGSGEVVKLEITASQHGGFVQAGSFTDTLMTVTHGATTAPVFNNYHGIQTLPKYVDFPPTWYLPQFWGDEMGGEWTIHFEDSAYNGLLAAQPTEFSEICVTFLDPDETVAVTAGEWIAGEDAIGQIGVSINYDVDHFEMQIDDVVDASGQVPWLELDVAPADAMLEIVLTAADGTVLTVAESFEDVPSVFLLEDLVSDWLTGRWSLAITDWGSTETPVLNGWSIHLGDEPPVDDGGVGPDGGMDGGV